MQELTICILSAVELPLPECFRAVEAQLGGPYRVIHVKDVFPMSAAFNAMIDLSGPARFVVQVDGDVVLHTGAVRVLYHFIKNRSRLYMAWGQLYEDGFGLGGSVRIWRRWPARMFRFRDRRSVDRDLHARIRWTGMRRQQVRWSDAPEKPFGTHFPRQTEFARFSKLFNDVQKWISLGRKDLVAEAVRLGDSDPILKVAWELALVDAGDRHRSKNAKSDWEMYRRITRG